MPRRADYHSNALPIAKVREAIAASAHAKAIGRPLNVSLDIHWHWTRFAKERIWNHRKAVRALLDNLRHWLTYHNVPFLSIAVRECPPDSNFGEHLHVLLHLPADLRKPFLRHVRKFLGGKKSLPRRALVSNATYNDGKLAYMLKGCTPPARELIITSLCHNDRERQLCRANIQDKPHQGIIYGKRLLISQALGPGARTRRSRTVKVNSKPQASQPGRETATALLVVGRNG
jgi:hypothetical protein